MKYINQKKYPHWLYVTRTDPDCKGHDLGKTSTVSSSGCGLCAAVMVADRLIPNCDFDLNDAVSLSYNVGANHGIGTDYALFAPAFAQMLGLKLEISTDVEDLRRCLRTGGAAAILVGALREGQGLFTRSTHYIVAISEEPDGRFAILDPSLTDTKYEEADRKGKVEIKHGVVILCDAPTLTNEEATWAAPYYLFWRQ